MADPPITEIDTFIGQIEEMWGVLATLFDEIESNHDWEQKNGPRWASI